MIQLTTIRGIYIPSESYRLGRKPCIRNCTIVTNDATTTMNAGILTPSGIALRSNEIIRFDNASTTVEESPIPIPLIADVVTASVGHIPSVSTRVGFSLIIPL